MDAVNNSVLGHIVAFTDGVAYLMPLCHVFHDINAVMKPNVSAQLPSSFSVLANLAHRSQLQADISLSNKYALEALSMAVLESDTSNPIAKLLQRAVKTSQDHIPFMILIRWAGSNIRQALLSPEAWLSVQNDIPRRQQIEEVLTLLSGLQDLEISPDSQTNPTSAIKPSLMEPAEEEKENAAEEEDPEPEYPTSWKLAMITIALCLSVFCMALVSSARSKCRSSQLTHVRTIRLLPPPFLESRINSRH